jgi:predicted HTH transcriptional regulator
LNPKIINSVDLPNDLAKWDINLINKLITILSIEGDNFDFKTQEGLKDDLLNDICGMANISGGFIVIGIDEIKNGKTITEFKKRGFKIGLEDEIQKKLTNYLYEVEPTPLSIHYNI